jgi:hypothetical protein
MVLNDGRQAHPLNRASICVRSKRSQATGCAVVSELIRYGIGRFRAGLKRTGASFVTKVSPAFADIPIRTELFMFGCVRHILPAAAGFLGVAAVWAGGGYLPQTGPIPLRFRALAPPVTQAPFVPTLTPVFRGLSEEGNGTSNAPIIQSLLPAAGTNSTAIVYSARDPEPATVPRFVPDPVVSPQMLVKYFLAPMPPTNDLPAKTIAPLGFTPPTTAPPVTAPPPPAKPANPILP